MAKLLFVVQQYAPEIGGLATSGTRISRTLAAMGHEIHVVALSSELDSGEADSEEFQTGLFVHRFGRSKQIDFTLQQLSIFYEWLHQKHRFDAVWGHYAGRWVSLQFGLPRQTDCHQCCHCAATMLIVSYFHPAISHGSLGC